MNTALQELIEVLESQKSVIPVDVYQKGIEYAIHKATELFEKEREQIKEAYKFGLESPSIELSEEWAEEYFNETYKQ